MSNKKNAETVNAETVNVNAETVNVNAETVTTIQVIEKALEVFGNSNKLNELKQELAEIAMLPEKFQQVCIDSIVKAAELKRCNMVATALFLCPTLTDKEVTDLVGGTEDGNRALTPVCRNMLQLFSKLQ